MGVFRTANVGTVGKNWLSKFFGYFIEEPTPHEPTRDEVFAQFKTGRTYEFCFKTIGTGTIGVSQAGWIMHYIIVTRVSIFYGHTGEWRR